MKNIDLNNEKWEFYRRSDDYLPEYIIDQDEEIICFMNERKFQDTEFELEEIERIEFRSKLISIAPDMYILLNQILDNLSNECEKENFKYKIKELISKVV